MVNEIAVSKREKTGTAEARRLRSRGRVPGIVYSRKGETRPVELNKHDFELMLHHHATENLIVDVRLDGEALGKALLKEVQHDPVTDEVLHVDFLQISMTEKLRVNIPIELTGVPVGVTEQGGILEHVLRQVEVECLPTDLVEVFHVDVAGLKLGDSLLVRDLKLGPQFALLTSGALAVVLVTEPKEEEVVAPEAAAEAAPTEPEVIGRKGKEEEEGEEAEGAAAEEPAKGGAKERPAPGKEKPAAGGKEKPAPGKEKPAAGKEKPGKERAG